MNKTGLQIPVNRAGLQLPKNRAVWILWRSLTDVGEKRTRGGTCLSRGIDYPVRRRPLPSEIFGIPRLHILYLSARTSCEYIYGSVEIAMHIDRSVWSYPLKAII